MVRYFLFHSYQFLSQYHLQSTDRLLFHHKYVYRNI